MVDPTSEQTYVTVSEFNAAITCLVNYLDKRFDTIDQRFAGIDNRLVQMQSSFDALAKSVKFRVGPV